MKMKLLSTALSACMLLPVAHADQFSWSPNVNQGYNARAGAPFQISGKAHVDAYNDTDSAHTYRYMLGVYTDCGANVNNTGLYSTDVTILPHTHFIEDRTISGYAKCNIPGNRKVTLTVGFSNNGGSVYYQQQFGYIHVI